MIISHLCLLWAVYLQAVYLHTADKYCRLTRRPSQEQKGLDERASWHPSGPLTPGDALEAGRADARRCSATTPCRFPLPCLLTPPLAVATAARETAAPRAGSRHDRSAPPPSLAYRGRHCLAEPVPLVGSGWAGPGVGWHGANKSCSTVIQGQLLPQPVFALAQRADPAPDRGHMLADGEVDPLHEGGVDVPARGAST